MLDFNSQIFSGDYKCDSPLLLAKAAFKATYVY